MTRTISFIIGIAVVALVAVPTAFADAPTRQGQPSPLSSSKQLDAVTFFYANERATIPFPATIHDHGDATQAQLIAQTPTVGIIRDHGDAIQAKLVGKSTAIEVARDHGDATQAKLTQLSGPVVARENSQRAAGQTDPLIVRDHGSAEQARLDAQSGTTSVVESTSGSELDWSQLALGFGVGLLLALGLMVGVQFARNERLAH